MPLSYGFTDNMRGEAILTAYFILNKVPHKKLDLSLYELWKGYALKLSYLKVWGCLDKVALPSYKRFNIGPKTFDVVFISYAQNSVAYRFMSLSYFSISEDRDAEFFEHVFPLKKDVHYVAPNVVFESIFPILSCNFRELVSKPIRSKRQRTETSFSPDFITSFSIEVLENFDTDPLTDEFMCLFLVKEDPKTYQWAMRTIDATF